jgi:gamma-tubulin complex component 5
LRTLRSNSYARTNHFDIQHQLEGLEEKFRVYNEDDLADALHQRLEELAPQSLKSTPEVLHLLLELSDKPVEKSKLNSLDFMKPPEASPAPHYTWEQLAAEDPQLRDGLVWQNIDYTAESSDDEVPSLGSDMEDLSLTETSTVANIGDGRPRSTDELTMSAENASLSGLEEAQFWRHKIRDKIHRNPVLLTELQVIREVLFLLSGLPTSLFLIRNQDIALSPGMKHNSQSSTYPRSPFTSGEGIVENLIFPSPGFAMKHASPQVLHAVLARFAKDSASILLLRKWAKSKESVPLLQSLQYEVMARIRQVDSKLSDLQARLLEPNTSLAISLTEVQIEVALMTRPLIKLADIIRTLRSEPYAHPFRCLELLYGETCTSQMAGDHVLYEYLGTLFFYCFHIYLRPIKTWMEEGELGKDDTVFFVSEMSKDLEFESLWLDRFRLRKTSNGTLHAPTFLHPATNKIFTTGKSVVVLKQLGKYDRERRPGFEKEIRLDFEAVCGSSSQSFAPFPELFNAAFDKWVKSKHYITSSTLRECLFDECGLRASLSAIENLYFMADGATTTSLANAIFQRLDSGKTTWNDRYILTELVQSTVGSLPGITAERLRTKISRSSQIDMRKSRLSVLSLASIAFIYSLPWPVQIIITKDTIPQYQKIFTFLLQIRRSSHKLQSIQRGMSNPCQAVIHRATLSGTEFLYICHSISG